MTKRAQSERNEFLAGRFLDAHATIWLLHTRRRWSLYHIMKMSAAAIKQLVRTYAINKKVAIPLS